MKIEVKFLGESGREKLLQDIKSIEIDLNPRFHWINIFFKDKDKIAWEHILSSEELGPLAEYISRFISDYFPKLRDRKVDILEITED